VKARTLARAEEIHRKKMIGPQEEAIRLVRAEEGFLIMKRAK
jgi:hypothetical protein